MNPMMLMNVVDYTKPIDSFADKLQFGGTMILLGMGTVFSVLLIIWVALMLFKLFFHDLPSKRKEKVVSSIVYEETPTEGVSANGDEIVAVLAAAIAMAESESDGAKFRVVSFKRR